MNDDSQETDWRLARRAMWRVVAATTSFALWHSLLCSHTAKETAKMLLGERRGAAWYRLFFIAQSIATTGALVLFIWKQPSRTLYDRRGLARVASWVGQAASLLVAYRAFCDIGPRHFLGLESLQNLGDGQSSIVEPEAQGPPLEHDGEIRVTGVYRWSRHPLEWAPIVLLWLTPRLKTNWLAFDLLATVYSLAGAHHEEKRLLQKDAEGFAEYQKQTAFFVCKPPQPQP